MKSLELSYTGLTTMPVEAECISPNMIAGKQLSDIEKMIVYIGNKSYYLSELFKINGDIAEEPSTQTVIVRTGTGVIKYIGASMSSGKIIVEGNAGMHIGSHMSGGEILVKGSVDDWAGAEMSGGYIKVEQNAGNRLGSAYRGSPEGMAGGVIIVDGNVGQECGAFMRRGMIISRKTMGPFVGVHMNGGEIFSFGRVSKRLGASAKGNGGFIACLGGVEEMLPTYIYDSTSTPTFMKVYLKQLSSRFGICEASKFMDARFARFSGDLACGGNNEIFVLSS